MELTVEMEAIVMPKDPAVAFLLVGSQHIEFVIADDAMSDASFAKCADQAADADAVGAAVDQVAQEDDRSFDVACLRVATKAAEDAQERVEFSVYVTDDVERAVGQRLNESGQCLELGVRGGAG
ncbi:MAG: hypothetical protein ACJAYU_001155 [Bradymonadia bacterium]|jgi:hypothetical protein